jgi:PEGA domain
MSAMNLRKNIVLLVLMLITIVAAGKDQSAQVIDWPPTGTPVLRFTFGKFKETGSIGNNRTYMIDTTAQNLWSKTISNANFSLYLFDKNKVRVGEGLVVVTNVGPNEIVKFSSTVNSSGTPVTLSLVVKYAPPELQPNASTKPVSITVNSIPQEASLKVDGVDAGITPKMVQIVPGKHLLEFKKEGFSDGRFPLEIGPNDVSGGSVSFELGTSAHDSIELRDGSVLTGDLESVSATEIVVRIGGNQQHLNRNQVKRIVLIQRDAPQ